MSHAESMLKPVAGSWLELQCQMIPSVIRGGVFLGTTEAALQTPAACWPRDTDDIRGLQAATRLALAQRSPALCSGGKDSSSVDIASPMVVDGQHLGIVAVEVANPTEQQQRAVIQLLQWGTAWFEFLVRRESTAGSSALTTVVHIIATSLEQDQFHAAATATATELVTSMESERVSIGFRSQRRTRVKAVSHSVKFSKKANLISDIGMAMDEALDQQCTIVHPPLEDAGLNLTCAHEELSANEGNAAVCTVPLGNNGRLYGAITFERTASRGFNEAAVEMAEVIASVLGPILEIKRREDRSLGRKIADAMVGLLGKLLGPRHVGLKLATLSLAALVGFMTLTSGHYRVSADAVLEGTVQRVVVAPMNGYIETAEYRAGDLVREGEVLGTLDDRDLRLELVR